MKSVNYLLLLALFNFSAAQTNAIAEEQKPLINSTAAPKGNLALQQWASGANAGSQNLDGTRLASVPKVTISSIEHITPAAREMADLAGISALLQELELAQRNVSGSDTSLAGVAKIQKLIYVRTKLNALIQAENVQINCTRGRLDAATAQAEELRAFITERRNRVTHKNSQINLISGGITKIVGYSIALAPLSEIPTNVLEVFDGTVQSSLSALALRQERQEAKMEHGLPPILDAFLSGNGTEAHFPKSVWRFMNDSDPDSKQPKSRRLKLIEGWEKSGILSKAKQANEAAKLKRNLSIELLDQRLAMLSDVKSVVSEMHSGLMELSDAIVNSYSVDPQW